MKKRLVVVSIGIFVFYTLLIMHFFKIQILEGKKWIHLAQIQHEYVVQVPFRRGAFYSNTEIKKGHPEMKQPFVLDVTKFHLYTDPVAIPLIHRQEISSALGELLKISSQEILSQLEKKSRSRRLVKWLSLDEKDHIYNWWSCYAKAHKIPSNALFFITDYQRCYPFGKLLGQFLHTIQEIKNDQTFEAVPTGGLESYFDPYLKGKPGKRKLMRSPRHALDSDILMEVPLDGADIYLTVNHYIQAICEEELEKGVIASKAKGGWVLMLDPTNGEILAYAQYPFFDPSKYQSYFNDEELIECTKLKAINDAYEIGSIMKPLILGMALQANYDLKDQGKQPIFDPIEAIDTSNGMFPGRVKPLKDPSFYKMVNFNMALQRSSNIYMAHIMDRMIHRFSSSWIREKLSTQFGFGQKTGIEFPAEAPGYIPVPGKVSLDGFLEWSAATPYSIALGHNILCTPLQMICAFSTLVNGGYKIKPTILKKIERKHFDGSIELLFEESNKTKKKVLQKEVCSRLIEGMKYVTKPCGTASVADIYGFTEGGKTGTAEKIIEGKYSRKKHLSSFIGFAPAKEDLSIPPRFVLLVSIDEPAHLFLEGGIKNHAAGRCAAPIFRDVAKRTLEYLGVEPDDPSGYPPKDPRFDIEKADWQKQVKELRLLFEQWNRSG